VVLSVEVVVRVMLANGDRSTTDGADNYVPEAGATLPTRAASSLRAPPAPAPVDFADAHGAGSFR